MTNEERLEIKLEILHFFVNDGLSIDSLARILEITNEKVEMYLQEIFIDILLNRDIKRYKGSIDLDFFSKHKFDF